jgi:hypothetical protein
LLAPAGGAGEPSVVITGGPDGSGREYRWVVTNDGDSPIVGISFAHYQGTLFFPPEGWSGDCTNLVNVGVRDPLGTCQAAADSISVAVAPGDAVELRLSVVALECTPRQGEMTVSFGDGSRRTVRGVSLPGRHSWLQANVSLIALGSMFVVWIIYRALRRRRQEAPTEVPG